ncbi:MAG: response regulator transcription factor [Chitinophagaceae bacterium]|jgi:DNA-binding NarL/FixJ family response regulator|nr:response regulator transcription factor [Chitinophagaceae bacterium]
MTVAFADDQEIIRRMLTDLLQPHHQLIFAASSAEALLRFLQANPASRHPGLVLMDISMDGMSGIEATKKVKALNTAIKVVMLTSFDDDEKVFEAIRYGADGYCIKNEMNEKLLGCIEDVGLGGSYMSAGIARKAMQYLQKNYVPQVLQPDSPLSSRETEVLRLVISGETSSDIATQLHVSLSTIKTHIYNIYQKLHVSNKMEAANLVKSKGWI